MAVNIKLLNHCLEVEQQILALAETLKVLLGKLQASVVHLQVVSVNPNGHLVVVAYLEVEWEAANTNHKAVSLDLQLLLEEVLSEEILAHHLSLVVKIFRSNII